tara:strand:+ start:888 stop:1190 length:303 start_codon:yes stop_codon:yes gene_type:complete
MIEIHEAPALYEHLIHFDQDKHIKVFLTVNTFKSTEYLSIRKYYQDFDEEWRPSKEGVSVPLDFENSRNLLEALMEILSEAETKDIIETHFKDILDKIYT